MSDRKTGDRKLMKTKEVRTVATSPAGLQGTNWFRTVLVKTFVQVHRRRHQTFWLAFVCQSLSVSCVQKAPPPPGVDDDSGSSSPEDSGVDEASMAAKARVNQVCFKDFFCAK